MKAVTGRILIVEDEETLRESLKRVFVREGHEVDCVGSSESALATIQHNVYDIIVSDIILPGMDGLELLKKCMESDPRLAIIIITAYASIDSAVMAIKAGAYDYIVKPIIHDDIKGIIRRALQDKYS
ncbi:MAG: response regulator [Nitrospiraceae bacterium]|nr:response regulator [Nitrospiraceae bacterium]